MSWRAKFARCFNIIGCGCLVLFAALGALRALAETPTAMHTIAEQYLFQRINAERAAAGLPALEWNDALTGAAQFHAVRMRAAGGISHQFSGEPDLAARASRYGAKFSRVAENVATSPSVLQMHTALMNSPHHRENILDPVVTSIGISVVSSGGQFWAVEDFAKDVQSLSFDEQEQQVGQLLLSTGLRNVTTSQEARTICGMSTGFVGRRPAFVMRYTASDLNLLPHELTDRLAQGGISTAAVGACRAQERSDFASYTIAIVLYR